MATHLRIDTHDSRPIWRQIEEGLLALVSRGTFAPGAAVPSVRELAKQLRVNPNTIAKVYQHLIEAGTLETRRGEGTFVVAAPPGVPARERQKRLGEAAERFAITSAGLGVESGDALSAAERALVRHLPARTETTEESS